MMTKIKDFFSGVFNVVSSKWKSILGVVLLILSALGVILGMEKIKALLGIGVKDEKPDNDVEAALIANREEIEKAKKWLEENKIVYQSNKDAIKRYRQYLNNDGTTTPRG